MHNNIEIRRRNPKFVIATIITAVMLLGTTAISIITIENVFAYDKNQAKSDINECGNGSFAENVGCQNTDSQIQGDENTVALASQQTFPSVTQPRTCEECFTTFLTADEIVLFEEALDKQTLVGTIEELCTFIEEDPFGTGQEETIGSITDILLGIGIDASTVAEIVDCLERVFGL